MSMACNNFSFIISCMHVKETSYNKKGTLNIHVLSDANIYVVHLIHRWVRWFFSYIKLIKATARISTKITKINIVNPKTDIEKSFLFIIYQPPSYLFKYEFGTTQLLSIPLCIISNISFYCKQTNQKKLLFLQF